MGRNIKLTIEVTLVLISVIIIVQNTMPVKLNILFWNFEASLIIILVLVLLLGMAIGLFLPKFSKKKDEKQG